VRPDRGQPLVGDALPELELALPDEMAGVREGQRPVLGRPADMVEVQVCVEDGVDVAGIGAGLAQARQEPAAAEQPLYGLERHGDVAEAEVHDDLAVAALDEEPAEGGHHEPVVVEQLRVGAPELLTPGREHGRSRERGVTVGQVGHPDVADVDGLEGCGSCRHRRPLCCRSVSRRTRRA